MGARFASRYANYKHGIRNIRPAYVGFDGSRNEEIREIFAVFDQATLNDAEIMQAIKGMVHKGLPIDRDTEEHFSPRSRISGLDTALAQEQHGWTDDERELVEKVLRESQHYGSDHIELFPVEVKAPWPNYSDFSNAGEIVKTAAAIGVPLATVIEFEKANLNRLELVSSLEAELLYGDSKAPVVVEA